MIPLPAIVGVVVSGESTLQPAVSAEISTWLSQHGHSVVAAPLTPDAINSLVDCFAIEDTACAKKLVDDQARADTIVYARVEASRGAVTITAWWLAKGQPPKMQRTQCQACSGDALKITEESLLFSLAASAPAAAPAPVATASAPAPAPAPISEHEGRSGLAVGAELGDPTSATVGWFAGKLDVAAAIGSATLESPGIAAHADVQMIVTRLAPNIPLRIGLGGRYYHHTRVMSIDETANSHFGVRASVSVALETGPIQLYAELAPGIDVKRTQSCTLVDGPDSICPHAQESPLFLQLVVGARWFISH